MNGEQQTLAVFIDFENLALGFKDRRTRFHIHRVLARLVEKGNIVVKRAYAHWGRFASDRTQLHEAAIELIEIPGRGMTGKNSADMRLCVDAMDLAFSKSHISTFVILSGDSDFSPLVSKLKENGKRVIGLGMRESTSELLRDNCDEFIYYEDLEAESKTHAVELPGADASKKAVFTLLLETLQALRRENKDTLWPSMIKETMKRKQPSFNEAALGFKTFSRLLEEAQGRGLVELTRDAANRSYIVTRFGAELEGPTRNEHQMPLPQQGERAVESDSVPPDPSDAGSDVPQAGTAKKRRRPRRKAKKKTAAETSSNETTEDDA